MNSLTIFNKSTESDTMEAQDKGLYERLEEIGQILRLTTTQMVACPASPVEIAGIVAADIFDAGDCFGTLTIVHVPKRGIIYSATFWDMDDEGSQVDLEVFKNSIAQIASDAAWAPPDADTLNFITELAFAGFDDHTNNQTSEINGINKGYTAPEGKLWIQAVCRGTPTIAVANMPRFQLQIISFDPDFKES